MCLACDYRVMSESAKVGLPEVKLGIYPGFGGTVRLPRLIGVDNAVEWIASSKEARPEDALKVGAVDAVVKADKLQEAALDLIQRAISGEFDYKAKRQAKLEKIQLNAIEQMMCFETAKGFIAGQAGPNYPAPLEAVEFLHIQNADSDISHYRGLNIDSNGQNLGAIEVSVRETVNWYTVMNGDGVDTSQYCTNTGGSSPAYAQRCFTINPVSQPTAAVTVRLWGLTSELNGIAEGNLAVYRNFPAGSGAWVELVSNVGAGND
jgi:hypothetical protein